MTLSITNPNPGSDYTYVLSGNVYESIVLGEGVDLDLNGYSVIGSGADMNSTGISSAYSGAEIYNGTVSGFGTGINVSGGSGAIGSMVVTNSLLHGITAGGGSNSVYGCTVGNVGTTQDYFGVTSGILFWDNNNYCYDNNVYGVHGQFENVAYVFGGSGSLIDCIAQGQNAQGYSMAVWNGGGANLNISGSYFWGYDFGISGTGMPIVQDTVIQAAYDISAAPLTDNGGNTFTVDGSDGSGTIYGTSGRETIVGSDNDDTIAGMGGADSLYGGPGADTFVFSPGGALSTCIDFMQGVDLISTAYYYADSLQYGTVATGNEAVMLWDASRHVLLHDADGAGGAGAENVAYLPYVGTLTEADFAGWV